MPLVKAENQIKRVHYHYSDCKTFDDMFGHRIAVVYGIKMIARAMHKPFTFSCGLAEGETSHGALDLMLLNSRADPYPVRSEEDHSAKELCQRYCAGRYCDWHSPNLDMASELMISDWKYLTQPDRVQVTDHDDAVIHLRLGGGLHSTYGANEGKGIFPHGTYINLIKQAQEEKGAIRSIGIVTAPFKGNRVRVFDSGFTRLSELITHEIDPKAFNIKSKNLSDLEIDSPQDSVRKVIDSFENKFLPGKEIISLNAAPALKISSVVDNFEDGYDLAYELISSGKALEKFDEFINFKS